MSALYRLERDYETPTKTIRRGVVKNIDEWLKIFPDLLGYDFSIKTDWFSTIPSSHTSTEQTKERIEVEMFELKLSKPTTFDYENMKKIIEQVLNDEWDEIYWKQREAMYKELIEKDKPLNDDAGEQGTGLVQDLKLNFDFSKYKTFIPEKNDDKVGEEQKPVDWDWEIKQGQSISEVIGEAIGGASMCWLPTPTGIFDSTNAGKIAERVTNYIQQQLDESNNLWGSLNWEEPKSERPPLGVMPEWRHKELRLQDLDEAINRYLEVKKLIPLGWIAESYCIREWLKNREEEKKSNQ